MGDALRAAWRACPAPPPRQGTTARLCHEPGRGLRVTANATDADIFSNARHCNDPTFALGDVVELFVAPVSSAWDNPAWYMEIDAASNGVLWGGLTYNPLGYKAPHQGGNFTGNETCARYEAAHPGACVNACNASTLDACALSCSGAASFYGGLTVRASTDGDSWWAADFWVPWAILPQLHSGLLIALVVTQKLRQKPFHSSEPSLVRPECVYRITAFFKTPLKASFSSFKVVFSYVENVSRKILVCHHYPALTYVTSKALQARCS